MKKSILFLLLFLNMGILKAQEGGTVVLIHGFLLSAHHMIHIEKALRPTCLDVYNFEYPARKDTICGHAQNLIAALKCIAAHQPGQPIHFVTHSIGGLILRCALNEPDCPVEAQIGKAVLLAPPNQGSRFARYFQNWPPVRFFFGPKSGLELLTWGPCDVQRLGAFPDTMQVLVIAGKRGIHPFFQGCPNDHFLLVEETMLETPYSRVVLCISHGETLTNEQSIAITRNFLLCGN